MLQLPQPLRRPDETYRSSPAIRWGPHGVADSVKTTLPANGQSGRMGSRILDNLRVCSHWPSSQALRERIGAIACSSALATAVACSSPPTDHLGGVTPADVVDIALRAGLTCAPASELSDGDAYTTECGDFDAGRLTFGGRTTETVSHISASAPLFPLPGTELALADAVAELDYEGRDTEAFKAWIRTQTAGITDELERDFGPARAMFFGNTLILESVGAS